MVYTCNMKGLEEVVIVIGHSRKVKGSQSMANPQLMGYNIKNGGSTTIINLSKKEDKNSCLSSRKRKVKN